jgi:hypothetical protein
MAGANFEKVIRLVVHGRSGKITIKLARAYANALRDTPMRDERQMVRELPRTGRAGGPRYRVRLSLNCHAATWVTLARTNRVRGSILVPIARRSIEG